MAPLMAVVCLLFVGAQGAAEERASSRLGNLRTRRRLNDSPPLSCKPITVSFDTAANGTVLPAGLYVESEWYEYGLLLSASGGVGDLPRLFDTANPRGPNDSGGDPDLGAPNEACGGPGIGSGGQPGEEGENCNPLGNVLIVQEPGSDVPDDNRGGGIITFDFPKSVFVYEMGLLDIEESTTGLIASENSSGDGFEYSSIDVPVRGNNSFQSVPIMTDDVRSIRVDFSGSGAVTHIKFCRVQPPNTPSPTSPPNGLPTPSPIGIGPPSAETCAAAKISFEYAADGTPLEPGSYVETEWQEYGLTLSATGGFGNLPRLFDTSVYRDPDSEGGDSDLGAPNQACRPPGPGRGEGGAPGKPGENCEPLGNVLIVQEEGVEVPDDSGAGGEIVFDFDPPAKLVNEMGFLDIDSATKVFVTHETQFGEFRTLFDLPLLGDNSKQTLDINVGDVKRIEVDMSGSGAVNFVSFCYIEATPPPTNTPSAPPTLSPTLKPSLPPSPSPTSSPTFQPTASPSGSPTAAPSPSPTASPTEAPSSAPTASPTASPTMQPTPSPTEAPSSAPTASPTVSPTSRPSASPTESPTASPTEQPTLSPTETPSSAPTALPTVGPTSSPTLPPTSAPTVAATANPTLLPTQSPTLTPTRSPIVAMPSKAPSTPPTPKTCSTDEITIDFDIAADGTQLEPGLYVEEQWKEYGLRLSASGGLGNLPRLFDTANPWEEDTGGDRDLGAPNWRCSPPGPGRGEGGEPGKPGENCDPLGNVLIIQEEDTEIPDDNFQGGMIVFDFDEPVEYVAAMGFLDVDEEAATLTVSHMNGDQLETTFFDIPQLGDNSKQTLEIGIENVTQIKLTLDRSGAVTFLSFCPSPPPSPYVLDFETTSDGSSIPAGAYLETEWEEIGVALSASGGFGTLPRALNSGSPGDATFVGSPNERCIPSGPGVGEGGEPDTQGDNCDPLGNVLIVEAVGDPLTVAPANEGMIVFEFEPVAPRVYEIGLLNIDVEALVSVLYANNEGALLEKEIDVSAQGPNSYQTVDIGTDNVRMVTVTLKNAGAIGFISFDLPLEPGMPTPAPTPLPPVEMSMSMSMVIETSSPTMVVTGPLSPSATATGFPTAFPSDPPVLTPSVTATEPSIASPSDSTPAPTTFRQEDIEQLRRDYNFAKAKWTRTGITSYSHSQQFTGFNRPWFQTNRVEVVDGVLVSSTFQDGDQDRDFSEYVAPIDGIFGFIDGVIENAAELVVGYDEGLGYPSYVFYQPFGENQEPIIFYVFDLKPSPTCPVIDDSCMNEENLQVCTDLIDSGCEELIVLESCPYQFICRDVTPSAAPTTKAYQERTISFEVDGDGFPLAPGTYVENEWESCGLVLSASGGFGSLPRLFDTLNPDRDTDLGTPNEACTPAGPGTGEGGEPGANGENCEALGNVLIIQQPGVDVPNDNADGGSIVFDFFEPAKIVRSMGFLDIDYETFVEVEHMTSFGIEETRFDLPLLGNNSKQTLVINIDNVLRIKVHFTKSGAVTFINLDCPPQVAPPSQTFPTNAPFVPPTTTVVVPTKSPTIAPTIPSTVAPPEPTNAPTRTPTVVMPSKTPVMEPTPAPYLFRDVVLVFNVTPDGTRVPAGAYVESEWEQYGIFLSASGGFGTLPRILDSSNPGSGAVDLGSPNERCALPGPGIGEGGEPDTDGENCQSLGNVIVVQDPSSVSPSANPGMIVFEFQPLARSVYELELLNIDSPTTITVMYLSSSGVNERATIQVPQLGVNSYQKVPINIDNVNMLTVNISGGGAVSSISFQYTEGTTSPPTPVPVETDPPTTLFPPTGMSLSMSMPPTDMSMSMIMPAPEGAVPAQGGVVP